MRYQLPTGGIIFLSVDEYLSLSDADLTHIINSTFGEEAPEKMYFENTKSTDVKDPGIDENHFSTNDIDYEHESDEIIVTVSINLDLLTNE